MIDVLRNFINENALIGENDKILLALSGGIDSIVLFDLLLKLKDEIGFSLFAAHFDHKIRTDSDDDAIFAQNLCERNSVKFFLGTGDVPQYAKEQKTSLETAARKLRHTYLQHIAAEIKANKIALAHHKNDRAETYLMRVFRGTSPDGLGCMPEKDGKIIRPLLCFERKDIENYAKVNKLSWREDDTNADDSYTRNNIRLNTVPHIRQNYNKNIVATLAKNASLAKQDRDFFEEIVQKQMSKAKPTDDGYYLDDDDFIYLHRAVLSRCIRKALLMLGIESDIYENNIEQVLQLFHLQKTGAMINLPQGAIARRDAYGVEILRSDNCPDIFLPANLNMNGITIVPDCGTFECADVAPNMKKIKSHSKNIAFFDTMSMPNDLVVRTRQQGDVFHQLGSLGKKSLKEYFIDKKISRFMRDSVPLIAHKHEILWIVGYEVSEKIKVTEDTILCKKIIFDAERG